ncbi:hypothetical protein BD769DRAFT_1334995, partial [Suillus cothurnatus]
LPSDATATQKTGLQEKQQKLAACVIKFHETADHITEGIELDTGTVHIDDPRFCRAEGEEQGWEPEVTDKHSLKLADEKIPAE